MKLDSKKIERVRSLLRDARKLIANKSRWCQGFLAVDDQGNEAEVSDEKAAQFCALGAIQRVGFERHFNLDTVELAENVLASACDAEFGECEVPGLNDRGFDAYTSKQSNSKTTKKAHQDILTAFTKAARTLNLSTAKELV